MDRVINDSEVVYIYTREDALYDGVIVEATSYLNLLNLNNGKFSHIYFTSPLFEDITNLKASDAIEVFTDLIEMGSDTDHKTELLNHFHLPNGKLKIRSSKESDDFILQVCYLSEE